MEMKFIKGQLGIKKLFGGIGNFFVRKRQWIIISVALVLLAFAGYLWYAYIIKPQWSDSQKQAYINTKTNEAVFNQTKFDSVISDIAKRKSDYNNDPASPPDIFNLK